MEYITSRHITFAESHTEFANNIWYNLWRIKKWPYGELIVGDIVYWYESSSGCIVWKSRVSDVDRFPYNGKKAVRERLRARLGDIDTKEPYFMDSPEQGNCLAWKVSIPQRVRLPKPDTLQFPQLGWLRVDDKIASKWLNQPEVEDSVTLDDIAPSGTLIETINQLNAAMADVSPKRMRSVVEKIIRGDNRLVKTLKDLCEYRCQFPGCDVRIPKRDGGLYIEVAHIKPVSKGGQSKIGNLLVLCPNHHKEFDYGDIEIVEQTADTIRGKLNAKGFDIRLPGVSAATQSD